MDSTAVLFLQQIATQFEIPWQLVLSLAGTIFVITQWAKSRWASLKGDKIFIVSIPVAAASGFMSIPGNPTTGLIAGGLALIVTVLGWEGLKVMAHKVGPKPTP